MSNTPRTDEVPTEESRIKRLREWAYRALLRQPGASIIERTIAEDVQHLEAKYQRENAALREQLAERDAEIAALKGSEYRAGMREAADIADTCSSVEGIAQGIRDAILAEADKP